MSHTQEIWEHDIRPPILRKIQAAKDNGRGVTVSPYWLSKILARLDRHEPPKTPGEGPNLRMVQPRQISHNGIFH